MLLEFTHDFLFLVLSNSTLNRGHEQALMPSIKKTPVLHERPAFLFTSILVFFIHYLMILIGWKVCRGLDWLFPEEQLAEADHKWQNIF